LIGGGTAAAQAIVAYYSIGGKGAAGSQGRHRTIAGCSGGAVGSTWRAPGALAVQMGASS